MIILFGILYGTILYLLIKVGYWVYVKAVDETVSLASELIDGEPIVIEEYEEEEGEETERLQEVILKQPKFDTSKITSYKGKGLDKFEFRPTKFSQFQGQIEAKERAKSIIKKVKRGIKAHTFIGGSKGLGKTTYAKILANDLNADFIETIGKQIEEETLVNIINQINNSKKENVVWFIDEIDSMDKKMIKLLNPIIESFEVGGKKIKPFIFMCATINKHKLLKNNPDTLDRIPNHLEFKKYNIDEISNILRQYKQHLYPEDSVSEEALKTISNNGKYNPRTSIALLEDYIVEVNVEKVLKNNRIVKDGLTETDIQILKILNNATRPMGANSLAMRIGKSQKEYMVEYEPYLVEYGYVDRVPSRVISDKGRKLIKELEGNIYE